MTAKHHGRHGRPWRRIRAAILAASDVCHLCGHGGAGEVDHLVPLSRGGLPHDRGNLAPAHGAKSRCPTCGQCCNQARGAGRQLQPKPTPRVQVRGSREW